MGFPLRGPKYSMTGKFNFGFFLYHSMAGNGGGILMGAAAAGPKFSGIKRLRSITGVRFGGGGGGRLFGGGGGGRLFGGGAGAGP